MHHTMTPSSEKMSANPLFKITGTSLSSLTAKKAKQSKAIRKLDINVSILSESYFVVQSSK